MGNNPASVTVLVDGSRAYTANQTDKTVTIVDLTSHTVEKTLASHRQSAHCGSIQNSQFGKVYVASPNSPYITIIRTDLDLVDTTILVEGNVLDVRVNSQNASGGNSNESSRSPGYGQPCNLPPQPGDGVASHARRVPGATLGSIWDFLSGKTAGGPFFQRGMALRLFLPAISCARTYLSRRIKSHGLVSGVIHNTDRSGQRRQA